ncbi:hypothetical protein [Agaribacterium sp. ZY112]|uniref:hypothetical protein n=1 Tax=Agaribacterium sp. ZY112 TaxID=3233574 RepID=UPI003526749A
MMAYYKRISVFYVLAFCVSACSGGAGSASQPTPSASPVASPSSVPSPSSLPTVLPSPVPSVPPTPEASASPEPYFPKPLSIPSNRDFSKSAVWYTYPSNQNLAGYGDFGANGAFWGHPPNTNFYDDATINNWVAYVQSVRDSGLDYVARGEFDWAWKWFIEYESEPADDWVRTLDGELVSWHFGSDEPLYYMGQPSGWVSNHSPVFVDWLKSQVDQILKSNASYIMFDSQTSSTRSTDLNQFGGDFSTHAMTAFREYMHERYSIEQLSALGIDDISTFNYRDFLISEGYTHSSYSAAANLISGGVPLFDDFIYFNRQVLNQKMAEVFRYIRTIDADIAIGATTAVTEARGYIFDENLTFLAGEHAVGASTFASEIPINIISHLKAAEAVDKTLVYFTYPWEFQNLRERNAPQAARGWIAQSYAMGAIFSIPAAVWVGGDGTWNIPADNYRDIYRFVSDKPDLFDAYIDYTKVALVSPMMAYLDSTWIDGSSTMHRSIRYLLERNLNFSLLLFGDEGRPLVPRSEEFERYDTIVVDADLSYLNAEQNALLSEHSDKILDLHDPDDQAAIEALRAENISVSIANAPADNIVSALSRVHKSNSGAPYIIHLLNRPVNATDGTTPVLSNVRVSIPQNYFSEDIRSITLHALNGAGLELPLSVNADGDYLFIVPNLGVWAILELEH